MEGEDEVEEAEQQVNEDLRTLQMILDLEGTSGTSVPAPPPPLCSLLSLLIAG